MSEVNEEQIEILIAETGIGEKHRNAWNSIVKPFIDAKEQDLFIAFCNTSADRKDLLVDIKLQHNALLSIATEFETCIETGQMAARMLSEIKQNEDNGKE